MRRTLRAMKHAGVADRYIRINLWSVIILSLTACMTSPSPKSRLNFEALSDHELLIAEAAKQRALETVAGGQFVEWSSKETGIAGKVQPMRTFVSANGDTYCREYKESLMIGRRRIDRFAVSCRSRDGTWRPVRGS